MLRNPFRRQNARSSLIDMASDLWAINDAHLSATLATARDCILNADVTDLREAESAEDGEIVRVEDGVAHIAIDGVLLSRGAALFRHFGIAATDYREIRSAIKRASKDDVKSVVAHIDSPGGMVSGLQATSSSLFALRKKKAVHTEASGIMASAAFDLGAQAGHITAEEGTEVGSIGVYAVVEDSSQMFEDAGIKVHVLRSGEHKGVGEPGVPITKKQLDKIQKQVNQSAEQFISSVARGRDMKRSEVSELATGETWTAEDAVANGLIDDVEFFDVEHNDAPDGAEQEEDRMSDDKAVDTAEVAALMQRLEALEADAVRRGDENAKALEEANAKIEGLKNDQKAAALDRACADGRVLPAEREVYEAMAKTQEPEAFASLLGKLAPKTHSEADGVEGHASHLPAEDRDKKGSKWRKGLGLADDDGPFTRAIAIDGRGHLVMPDGTTVDPKGAN